MVSTLVFSEEVNRIVSLGPSISAQLDLLGESERLVGRTNYCSDKYSTCDKVGSLLELNTEKIVTLNPDIVIAISLTPKTTIDKLKSFGIRVETVDDALSFNSLTHNLKKIAKLCGVSDIADSIIVKSKLRLDSLSQFTPNRKKNVVLQIGANPVFVTIGGKMTSEILTLAGVENPFESYKTGSVSREEVLLKNPDVILITEMGISGELEQIEWQKFPFLKAVKNSNIHIVNTHLICSPTVPEFVDAVGLVRKHVYGVVR
jgi:ABC-type Fe3+-hydroxamate transport system substrate-binding protein